MRTLLGNIRHSYCLQALLASILVFGAVKRKIGFATSVVSTLQFLGPLNGALVLLIIFLLCVKQVY